MKTIVLLLVLMISLPSIAVDKCNPYVKKSVRELVVCQMDELRSIITDKTNASKSRFSSVNAISTAYIGWYGRSLKRRQQWIDALDAKAISEQDALKLLSLIVDADEADGKIVRESADAMAASVNSQPDSSSYYQAPAPTVAPAPTDVTCKKQYNDSVRCRPTDAFGY